MIFKQRECNISWKHLGIIVFKEFDCLKSLNIVWYDLMR